MPEAILQKQILDTLLDVKKSIDNLRNDVDYLMEYIEDTKLSEDERRELEASIKKIKSGDSSEYVSWTGAKKELNI